MWTYLRAILIGFVIWAIIGFSLLFKISMFSVSRGTVLYIHLFFVVTHLVVGFVIGWFAKNKGWLLGLLFGIVVIMIGCVFRFSEDMPLIHSGTFGAITQIMLSPSTVTIIVGSTVGGWLGNWTRVICKR
jgi:hypothetical protein